MQPCNHVIKPINTPNQLIIGSVNDERLSLKVLEIEPNFYLPISGYFILPTIGCVLNSPNFYPVTYFAS